MPALDQSLTVVHEWICKAENDLKNAIHTLKLGKDCPTDTVCFHAQQCVEKYVKALLVFKGVDFPKTHDLERLVSLLPVPVRLSHTVEEQGKLTDYATHARYPGWSEIPLAEARWAVRTARRIRGEIRAILSEKVARKGK
ncbi:MAG: HEPN domain-containing protein [Verrucomicrobia bacterium]|nr:HEPN domain-containing protein [Verrucomicrobiota bacterium]